MKSLGKSLPKLSKNTNDFLQTNLKNGTRNFKNKDPHLPGGQKDKSSTNERRQSGSIKMQNQEKCIGREKSS